MSSTDPVSSITNCYTLIVSYTTQYTASSCGNAQLSQLDLVLCCASLYKIVPEFSGAFDSIFWPIFPSKKRPKVTQKLAENVE